MPVTRCVCHQWTFEALRQLALERNYTFNQLRAATRCCTGCGMCEPYVRLMMETGQTSFAVFSPEEHRTIMSRAYPPISTNGHGATPTDPVG